MRFALTKPGGGVVFLKNEKPVNFYLSLPANIQETIATKASGGKTLPIHSRPKVFEKVKMQENIQNN